MILIKIVLLYLLADFVTGLFHFLVDRYGKMNGRYMTKSVNLLLIHHEEPRKIISQTYWEITGGVYKISLLIFCISLMWGFNWELLIFLLFCSNGNMIHKWSHQQKSKTSFIIRFLQKFKLIQTQSHHSKHHIGHFNKNYCVMTIFINPILHQLRFWESLIYLLKLVNIKPINSST